ncbi:MAG TPA: helicase C-terminal domain-containing protein [Thermotogota bacterium]|nr:helicase C-terminal domain-containing protein [Thermotogota bacterium]
MWQKYFPYDSPRKSQTTAIDFSISAFTNNKFVCLELPTGIGKSGIAITLAKYFRNSYILTTQKILQAQYIKDFSEIPNIWSISNYKCTTRPNISCEVGKSLNNLLKSVAPCKCKYDTDKKLFTDSPVSLTNVPFFLYSSMASDLAKRKLLIIDEAHNLDSIVTEFVSLKILRGDLEEANIGWLKQKRDIFSVKQWIINSILPSYIKLLEYKKITLNDYIKKYGDEISSKPEIKTLVKQIDYYEKMVINIQQFNTNSDKLNEWVLTISNSDDEVIFRPLFSNRYSNESLYKYADKVLFMSGTILDKKTFCNNNGIDESQCAFLSLDSEFDKNNRPIFTAGVASLSYKNIDKSLPIVTHAIDEIINDPQHKDVKGIIHSGSFKILKYIKDNIKNDRLLFHTSEDNNKIDIYKKHMLSDEPTILVSPGMNEGVDLVDDLSRFQIIVKIPYPYLGDNYIKTKMEKIQNWYSWTTAKTLMQSCGRSIRNEDDWSITYILDSDWNYFYHKNKSMFPKWFLESIIK